MFAAEAGTIEPDDRANLEAFTKRGGGIVAIHDAVLRQGSPVVQDRHRRRLGARQVKFLNGTLGIYVQDYPHEITRGVSNFMMDDEIYWDLHLQPEAKVIGTAFRTPHENHPQMWSTRRTTNRAFVNIQGHKYTVVQPPHYRALLLRGIAWAGKRPVDSLVAKDELASSRIRRGAPPRPRFERQDHGREGLRPPPDARRADVVKPISMNWTRRAASGSPRRPATPRRPPPGARGRTTASVYYDKKADAPRQERPSSTSSWTWSRASSSPRTASS